ncbi:MAG: hypothetical protein HND57_06225 [Planctomycetes bacterium]|nr:hypothetical protein [Planctomycetota bacterium]
MSQRVVALYGVSAAVMTSGAWAAGVEGYYQFPAVHGDTIVFTAEGDLWKGSIIGGTASRLTTHDGTEAFARISPDGQWIAFSAEYDGNVDVYVMSFEGSEPQRLTFHPTRDEVVAWKPDSSAVVFRSRRVAVRWEHHLYEVPVDGGHPAQVPVGSGALCSYSDDGQTIAYNRLGGESRTWKRYTGGTTQDIWLADLSNGSFRQLTTWEGSDRFPMWYNGRLYYLSDADGKRMNIHSMRPNGSDRQQHTFHTEYDARWPDLHDGRIVYMYAGGLSVLDLSTGTSTAINMTIASDRTHRRAHFEDATATLERYELNQEGDRLVITSRGEIWNCPVEEGRVIQVAESSGTRQREAVFAPDGQTIACITDETGEQEIALYTADGSKYEVLTSGGQGWVFAPVWSPDGTRIAYSDLTMSLYIVDSETGDRQLVESCPDWEIEEYVFSPDNRYLAYTRPDRAWGSRSDICVYEIETQQTHVITTKFSHDHDPAWDPDGRYLYFLSSRSYNPLIGERDFNHVVTETTKICGVILQADGLRPSLPHELYEGTGWFKDEEGTDDDDEIVPEEEGIAANEPAEEVDEDVVIDFDGLLERVFELPTPARNCGDLAASSECLYYISFPSDRVLDEVWGEADTRARNTLYCFDLYEAEEEALIEGLIDYVLSGDMTTVAVRLADDILVGPVEALLGAGAEGLEDGFSPSDLRLKVTPAEEWAQIFKEAWRLQRDFYFVENMAGLDWDLMYERYSALLPRLGTRQELNDLIGQLIGELGTSHTYVWGGDLEAAPWVGVGLLGADVEPDQQADAHQFVNILRPEAWETESLSPLTMTHADVQTGEYLFAINGHELTASDNVYEHLANLPGDQVLLTVGAQADGSDTRDVQIQTLPDDRDLRYRDWCRRNREYVAQASGGRIGYFHLPDMDAAGLIRFVQGFYPQVDTDGLIIDVRYNGGGWVSQMIIERLARTAWAYDFTRRGKPSSYPDKVHVGPKAVLINQFAGSDGDIFPESFKLRKLGPVIGMRTWGGVVGIRGDKSFVDGGLSTQPEFAWWEPGRGWGLENRGVEPDITVDILPADELAGRDPQLQRAIAEVLDALVENPPYRPSKPAPPDKTGMN